MSLSEALSTCESSWDLKYQPKTLDDMILSPLAREQINKYIAMGSIENLILCSRPGQGKTSLAKVLAKSVFNCDYTYINCSDKGDVKAVRNEISNAAASQSTDGNFKIIILDEADGFPSKQAQYALRGLMDEYGEHTRFIITANYEKRIIEPLRSRCKPIDIRPSKEGIGMKILQILAAEGVQYTNEELNKLTTLIDRFYPDIRSTIKHLEDCVTADKQLKVPNFDVASEFIMTIYKLLTEKKLKELRSYIIENEGEFYGDYAAMLDKFYEFIIDYDNVPDKIRAVWTITLAEYIYRSSTVLDQELNCSACFFSLANALK